MSLSKALRLVPALFRFVAGDVVRSRSVYFAGVLAGYFTFELVAAVVLTGGSGSGFGSRFILVSLIVSAPLCRPWLNEDIRLGYAALWLQKPVAVFDYYFARILAVFGWCVVGTIAIGLASLPASIGTASLIDVGRAVVTLGWIPTTLAVLSFLGAGLGARNSGLFAYGALFAGFALPGFRDAVWLGPLYWVLKVLLPPAHSALQANTSFGDGNFLAAAADLQPLLVYILACSCLALALGGSTAKRLARA
ncbi:MAG: hypothetical protein GTO46_11155 [Gemmatimonadetes bacterium]|nr:hypothetical protein [Gemmatimonadota bacterium]NIO32159.1 hypothetical protein [Gemmatimonadota bacterium]